MIQIFAKETSLAPEMLSVETIRLHRVLNAPVTPMVTIKDKHGAILIVNGTTINAQKKVKKVTWCGRY